MHLQTFDKYDEAVTEAVHALGDFNEVSSLLISGGSSFAVFEQLNGQLSEQDASRIHLYQVDERYGDVGHPHSNWALLPNSTLERYASANPMLQHELTPQEIADEYTTLLEDAITNTKTVAVLGVGEDSHIAGIKPMAQAQFESTFSTGLVNQYEWEDFHRITTNLQALMQIDTIIIFASGASKTAVIESIHEIKPVHDSPLHGLLEHPNTHIIHSKE